MSKLQTLLVLLAAALLVGNFIQRDQSSQAASPQGPDRFEPATSRELLDPSPTERNAWTQSFEHDGLSLELSAGALPIDETSLSPGLMAGTDIQIRFRIRDTATGSPIPNLYPAGWLEPLPSNATIELDSTRAKAEAFLVGSVFGQATVDLNTYQVVTLNDNASLHVVDPLFGFGGSKLLTAVPLASMGHDWSLDLPEEQLFVSMPEAHAIATVNTANWTVAKEVAWPGKPHGMALQPDGRFLWVVTARNQENAAVLAMDTKELRIAHEIPASSTAQHLAFTSDSRWALLADEHQGEVQLVEVSNGLVAETLALGFPIDSVAYSSLARRAYALNAEQGVLVSIDPDAHQVVQRISVDPGSQMLTMDPIGRRAVLLNPSKKRASVFDTATSRVTFEIELAHTPLDVSFSDQMAYIRHADSPEVALVPLAQFEQATNTLSTAGFQGGQLPPQKIRVETPGPAIVQAPGANAVLLANPADQTVYFYKEGMAAPMGSFQNYGQEPRSVLVLDRSLSERKQQGDYETVVRFERPGRYELVFFLDAPRIVRGFEFVVQANEAEQAKYRARASVELERNAIQPVAGEPWELRFQVKHAETGAPQAGLTDLTGKVLFAPGSWHTRFVATEIEAGVYAATIVAPQAGVHHAFVQSPSLGLAANGAPAYVVVVGEGQTESESNEQ